MPDIFSDFPIRARNDRVFEAISTPGGLDAWWTKESSGSPVLDADFELGFGPGYDWRASVTRCAVNSEFELRMIAADSDWISTRVGFRLEAQNDLTQVRFYHTGWPTANAHWRGSCYCWPMYLRLLRRHVENGEFVPYEQRLDV